MPDPRSFVPDAPSSFVEETPSAAAQQPGLFERLGGWRGAGALGVRALAGVLGAEGGAPGSLIGAGGEALAEMIEKGTLDPTQVSFPRVATEAALGAVPLRRIFQVPRALAAARSAALSGVGEAGRELARGEQLSPSAIGTATGIGAVTGGVFGGIGRGGRVAGATEAAARAPEASLDVVPTSQTARPPRPRQVRPQGPVSQPSAPDYLSSVLAPPEQPSIPYPGSPTGPGQYRPVPREVAADIKAAAAATKAAQERAAEAEISQTLVGREPQEPSITRTVKAGDTRMIQRFIVPQEEEEAAAAIPDDVYEAAKARALAMEPPTATAETAAGTSTPTAEVVAPAGKVEQPAPPSEADVRAPIQRLSDLFAARERAAAGRTASPTMPQTTPTGELTPGVETLRRFQSPLDVIGQARQDPNLSPLANQQLGVALKAEAQRAGLPTSPGVANLGRFLQSRVSPAISEELGRPTLPVEEPRAPGAALRAKSPKPVTEVPTAQPGPETPAPSTEGVSTVGREMTPEEVADQDRLINEVAQEPGSFRENMLKRLTDPTGSITLPELSPEGRYRLLGSLLGVPVGAGIGAATDQEDPALGALRGGAIGGMLGGWVSPTEGLIAGAGAGELAKEAFKNLVNVRRASLLYSAGPTIKKAIADPAGLFSEGLTNLAPGAGRDPELGKAMIKQALGMYANPEAWRAGIRSIGAEDVGVLPKGARGLTEVARRAAGGPLGFIHAPLEVIQGMTREAAEAAGASPETVGRITGGGLPATAMGRGALQYIQKYPALQFLQPFTKVPIHIAEGIRNVPGIAQFAYGPEEVGRRAFMGGSSMALGALEELYNEQQEEAGTPVSPLTKALESNVGGLQYVAPNILGKALTSYATGGKADALRELLRLIPAGHLVPDLSYNTNQTTRDIVNRELGRQVRSMAPGFLLPEPGSVR